MKLIVPLTAAALLFTFSNAAIGQTLKPASDNMYKYEQMDGSRSQTSTATTDQSRGGHRNPPSNNDPLKVPFDGGLSLFVVAASGLAIRRKMKRKAANV